MVQSPVPDADHGQQFNLLDACPSCDTGKMLVYASRVKKQLAQPMRLRYLRCSNDECKYKPKRNKVFIPLEHAPERPAKERSSKIKMRRIM